MTIDRAAKKRPPSAVIRDVQRDRENSHEVCPMAFEITSTARGIGKLRLLAPSELAKVATGPTIRPPGPTQRPVHRPHNELPTLLFLGWQNQSKPPILIALQ